MRYSYSRRVAEKRALKSSGTAETARTTTSGASSLFIRSINHSGCTEEGASNETTCAAACTPASVRPAPTVSIGAHSSKVNEDSSSPWTVRACFWRAKPWKSVPSYAISSAIFIAALRRVETLLGFFAFADQRDDRHRRRVAFAEPGPHDPRVAARPLGVLRRDLREQLVYDALVGDHAQHATARCDVPLLREGDHALGQRTRHLGARNRRLHLTLAEQRRADPGQQQLLVV